MLHYSSTDCYPSLLPPPPFLHSNGSGSSSCACNSSNPQPQPQQQQPGPDTAILISLLSSFKTHMAATQPGIDAEAEAAVLLVAGAEGHFRGLDHPPSPLMYAIAREIKSLLAWGGDAVVVKAIVSVFRNSPATFLQPCTACVVKKAVLDAKQAEIASLEAQQAEAQAQVHAFSFCLPDQALERVMQLMRPPQSAMRLVCKQYRQVWDLSVSHLSLTIDGSPPLSVKEQTEQLASLFARVPNTTSIRLRADPAAVTPTPIGDSYITFCLVIQALSSLPSITRASVVPCKGPESARLHNQNSSLQRAVLDHMDSLDQLRLDLAGDSRCCNTLLRGRVTSSHFREQGRKHLRHLDIVGEADFSLAPDDLPPRLLELRGMSIGRLVSASLDTFERMPQLTSLSLSVVTESIAFLSSAAGLQELHLDAGPRVQSLQPLASLLRLRTLHLSSRQIVDGSIIGLLTELTDLALKVHQLRSYAFIGQLRALTRLRMYTRESQALLPLPFRPDSHPWLHSLLLANHKFGTHSDDMRCVGQLTGLRSLDLQSCWGVGGDKLLDLSTLTRLSALSLRSSRRPSEACVQELLPHLPALLMLDLSKCGDATHLSFGPAWVEDDCMTTIFTDIPSTPIPTL